MRVALIGLALAAVALGSPAAQARGHGGHSHSVRESSLTTHRHYRNVGGHIVHSPSRTLNGRAPAHWTAKCGDGSYSFSEHHRGACSHHAGVATWH